MTKCKCKTLDYEIAAFTNRLTVDGCSNSAPNSFQSEAGMQYQCYKSNTNDLKWMVMNAVAEQRSNIEVGFGGSEQNRRLSFGRKRSNMFNPKCSFTWSLMTY